METLTTTTEKFKLVKPHLDGIVFWREVAEGIEIKFIRCYLKYIPKKLIEFLQ